MATLLARIERATASTATSCAAIWGIESHYGHVLSNPKLVKSTIRSLATLAWSGGRLAKFGRQQLVAALKIVQRGDISAGGDERLVGRRHGPDPVHPDHLRGLRRRL